MLLHVHSYVLFMCMKVSEHVCRSIHMCVFVCKLVCVCLCVTAQLVVNMLSIII